tara:strand:+ start:270 stop:866 length:597 start_codon:yes stop_codon:yes gene_type:complete
MNLTKIQKAALAGAILGDAYLQATGRENARLRFEHSLKQRLYLEWKVALFPELFQGKSTILRRVHPDTKRTYSYIRHQSNTFFILGEIRRIFYPNGKKRIPDNLIDWLTDNIALAVWYFDDGYYYPRDRCAYIYLGRVSLEEAETSQIAIIEKFKLSVRVLDKKTKGFALYFSPQETLKLAEIVRPFILPSMAYKIPS